MGVRRYVVRMTPVRTFVALRVGQEAADALHAEAERLAALAPALRPIAPEDLHLTLHFLGDTPLEEVHRIARVLREAAAASPGALHLGYGGLGAFPTPARARVVWAGLPMQEPEGALTRLVQGVAQALDRLGYPPERRRWHPHVTLGRLRGKAPPELAAALDAKAGGPDPEEIPLLADEIVSSLHLISSEPGRSPYHYTNLTTIPLL